MAVKPAHKLLAVCVAVGLIAVTWVVTATAIDQQPDSPWRPPHASGRLLAMTFAHQDHTQQACVGCHHNYVDDTGSGTCLDCHKSDITISPLMEEQFHGLCMTCHLEEQVAGNAHGPVRDCLGCHTPDQLP